jgi:uncharacterized protein
MPDSFTLILGSVLERIAAALERLSPPPVELPAWTHAPAFVWRPETDRLLPVETVCTVPLDLLQSIDNVKEILLANTRRFTLGQPANNALLWGARGMGKSSLVKAVHTTLHVEGLPLKLVEIQREDIATLPRLLAILASAPFRFLLFCDDLSFEKSDSAFKVLKSVLDGGIEGRPDNVLFYATSNRRHLVARDMIENECSSAIHPGEAVEEHVSLSDRFGLWLGFHASSQQDYLGMVRVYAAHYGLLKEEDTLMSEALAWSLARGSRSGRTAWQFIQSLR